MNRKLTTGILLLTFSLTGINAGFATEVVNIPPVIVQPYDINQINQQTLQQDRDNRDQEAAIKQLIDNNQKLAASQQNPALGTIAQTMAKYRDSLFYSERERLARASRYYDLIRLTEDVDDMKGVGETMSLYKDVLADKYQVLDALKNEMLALNDKLKNQGDYKQEYAQDEIKVQDLTQQLAQMDAKISQMDLLLSQKDGEIAQLRNQIDTLRRNPIPAVARTTSNYAIPSIVVNESSNKDAIIRMKDETIRQLSLAINRLQNQMRAMGTSSNRMSLPPVVVNTTDDKDQIIAQKDDIIRGLNETVAAFKSKLALSQLNTQAAQEKIIGQKDNTIRWLNQTLDMTKEKARYYQLTSQKDRLAMQDFQQSLASIKDDFAQRLKNYNHNEKAMFALKDRQGELEMQVSRKQSQVDLLKSELESKITEIKDQAAQSKADEATLKAQIQHKQTQITKMQSDIQAMLQNQTNNDNNHRQSMAENNERMQLARELIGLQEKEASLLQVKDGLEQYQNALFDRHVLAFENRIKQYLGTRQIEAADLQNRLRELQDEMGQKEQEVSSLTDQLKDKIAQEKNQEVLSSQITDLHAQLRGKEDEINTMKQQLMAGQGTEDEMHSLKQQLAQAQDKAGQLQMQLNTVSSQSQSINAIVGEYQKKLEDKNTAYNDQLKQISMLNLRLQQKQGQINALRRKMHMTVEQNSQQLAADQAKELDMSMVQQKAMDDKIKALRTANAKQQAEIIDLKTQLGLARQQLQGMPSSDEIEFLRTGLTKATAELKQKNDMLLSIKANADEYTKKYKEQTEQFESLKQQFEDAQEDIQRKDEDFKYKQMELIRYKEQATLKEGQLEDQIKRLTHPGNPLFHRARTANKTALPQGIFILGKSDKERVLILEDELRGAQKQIDELETELNQFQRGPAGAKLNQAMDKINAQGRVINALVAKLQDKGESVDLSHIQ